MPYRSLAYLETGVSLASHLASLIMILAGVGWATLVLREAAQSIFLLLGLKGVGGLTLRRLRWLSLADWVGLIKEARAGWLDGVLEGAYQRMTIILAGALAGEHGAGLFFQAQRLAVVPHQFLAPVVGRIAANWFGRTEDGVLRRKGRNRLLLWAGGPLLIAGALTVLFADPVVPWLFGEKWAASANLLVTMFGIVVFLSLFELYKAYCWVARMMRYFLVARIFQYLGCFLPLLLIPAGQISGLTALSVGQSVAYGLGFAAIVWLVWRRESDGSPAR